MVARILKPEHQDGRGQSQAHAVGSNGSPKCSITSKLNDRSSLSTLVPIFSGTTSRSPSTSINAPDEFAAATAADLDVFLPRRFPVLPAHGQSPSDLHQREYCEAHGIPLKAFGNWRASSKPSLSRSSVSTDLGSLAVHWLRWPLEKKTIFSFVYAFSAIDHFRTWQLRFPVYGF